MNKKIQDIKLDFNAICEFEKTTGKSLLDMYKSKSFALNDLRAIVKAGLSIEEDEAGDLIANYIKENDFASFSDIINDKLKEFNEEFDKKK